MHKIKKEINLEKENKFITKYGTTFDDIMPPVFYLRSKTKITPLSCKDTYEKEIDLIKSKFLEYVQKTILNSKVFENDYLSNIDISSTSITYGKTSFLRYDVYLKPLKKNTLLNHQKLFSKISNRFDKKLIKLLSKYNIEHK